MLSQSCPLSGNALLPSLPAIRNDSSNSMTIRLPYSIQAFYKHRKRSLPPKNPKPSPLTKEAQLLHGITPVKPLDPSMPLLSNPGSDSGLRFRSKLLYLEKLNVDSTKALERNPYIRSTPLESLKSIEKCLYQMGLEKKDIGRIFSMLPQLLTSDIHQDLYPVFEFLLNEVKIPYDDLRKTITRCPRLLVCNVRDQLRPTFHFLQRFGFVGSHAITCQTTLLLVSSVEDTLMPKIDYLQSLGFSYGEVVRMVLRSPALFTFSISNNFEPKLEYFLNEMGGALEELKEFPHYFSFSLEGKIKPRHQLLVEHKMLLSLSDMLKVSDGEFNDRMIEMRLQAVDEKMSLNT